MAGKKRTPKEEKFTVHTTVPPELEIDNKSFGGIDGDLGSAFNSGAKRETKPATGGDNQFLDNMIRNFEADNDNGDDDDDIDDGAEFEIEFTSEEDALALAELADEWIPQTDECENIRDHISNYDLRSLVAARILRDEFEGRLPKDGLDSLMAAMLALGADNCNELFNEMGPRTLQAVDETIELMVDRDAQDDLENGLKALARGTPIARLMMLSSVVADLELIWDDVNEDASLVPEDEMLEGAALLIQALARPGDLDQKMLERAAQQFNLTSDICDSPLYIRAKSDGTIDVGRDKQEQAPAKKPKPPGLN